MDVLDEDEQLRAINQLDGFAGGEVLGVTGEFARRDNDDFIRLLVMQQAEHFTNDRSADGEDFPLLALNQRSPAIPAEGQIHATVSAMAQRKINLIALTPIRLGDKKFKLFPRELADGFDAGLLVQQAAAMPAEPERAGGNNGEQKQDGWGDADECSDEPMLKFVITDPKGNAPSVPPGNEKTTE